MALSIKLASVPFVIAIFENNLDIGSIPLKFWPSTN